MLVFVISDLFPGMNVGIGLPSELHIVNKAAVKAGTGLVALIILSRQSTGLPAAVIMLYFFGKQAAALADGLTFSWFGINPFTNLDKGGQNAHPKSPLFQKFLENIFLETKKPPISLVIEVNRRRVEIFIILVYNRKLRERQICI